MAEKATERNQKIIDRALEGDTLKSIASQFKITSERVRQILEAKDINIKEIRSINKDIHLNIR